MFVEAAGELVSHCRTAFPSGVTSSADGQFLVLTHGFLHILTPALGLSIRDDRSALSGLPGNKLQENWSNEQNKTDFKNGECTGLPIYKTSIVSRKRAIEWEEFSLDPRLATPAALDNGWRMATWSPSGLSEIRSCLLATLNVNRDVILFSPGNDAIKATWNEGFDLTSAYLDHLLATRPDLQPNSSTASADERKHLQDNLAQHVQATSVSWSSATPSFAIKDQSLLAVGHKAGQTTFWRYQSDGSMELGAEMPVLDVWPIVMCWSPWTTQPDTAASQAQHSSLLAIGGSSGPIKILQVTIQADESVEINEIHSVCSSSRSVTVLRWEPDGRLLIGRLSSVTIWTPDSSQNISLPIEEFGGYSSIPTPVDFVSLAAEDRMIVALTDGTLRSIDGVTSGELRVSLLQDPKSESEKSSRKLSEAFHASFMSISRAGWRAKTKVNVPKSSAMIVSGCAALDAHGTVLWGYEKYTQDRRIYNMAALHKFNFGIGRLAGEAAADASVQHVQKDLTAAAASGCAEAASKSLFPLFLSLRHHLGDDSYLSKLSQQVKTLQKLDHALPAGLSGADDFAAFLLEDATLQALRLGNLVARRCATTVPSASARQDFEEIYRRGTLAVYCLVFEALLGYLTALGSGESRLLERYSKIKATLSARRSGEMAVDGDEIQEPPLEAFPTDLDDEDSCAACREVIPFNHLTQAVCRNGHAWGRCSITLEVMFGASARTCTGCGRKSQIPKKAGAQGEEKTAQQALLDIARCCLFCSGRWTYGH